MQTIKGETREFVTDLIPALREEQVNWNATKNNPNSNASDKTWLAGYNYAYEEVIRRLKAVVI